MYKVVQLMVEILKELVSGLLTSCPRPSYNNVRAGYFTLRKVTASVVTVASLCIKRIDYVRALIRSFIVKLE